MKVHFTSLLQDVRTSYWFLPTIMAGAAIILSFITIAVDENLGDEVVQKVGLIWGGGPEGARGLLSAVATSMITVAGVTFSITMVTLSLASSQFGPRLLRSFMRDTSNQVVLGTFVSTFIYCLLVLRTVRSADGAAFVPHLSVSIAILLTLASIGVLIYFIHHTSRFVQAPVIISIVGKDLISTIDQIFPSRMGQRPPEKIDPNDAALPDEEEKNIQQIGAAQNGYIQAIDEQGLIQFAEEGDFLIRLFLRPGKFVMAGQPLMDIWPADRFDQDQSQKVQQTMVLGSERTEQQDLEFIIEQLVQVAIRALSPSSNDNFTAISCIDWLGAALLRLGQKEFPSQYRYSESGKLRVVVLNPLTYPGLVDAALDQIRQSAVGEPAVLIRLLEVITTVIEEVNEEEKQEPLLRQATMVIQSIQEAESLAPDDQTDLLDRYLKIMEVVES